MRSRAASPTGLTSPFRCGSPFEAEYWRYSLGPAVESLTATPIGNVGPATIDSAVSSSPFSVESGDKVTGSEQSARAHSTPQRAGETHNSVSAQSSKDGRNVLLNREAETEAKLRQCVVELEQAIHRVFGSSAARSPEHGQTVPVERVAGERLRQYVTTLQHRIRHMEQDNKRDLNEINALERQMEDFLGSESANTGLRVDHDSHEQSSAIGHLSTQSESVIAVFDCQLTAVDEAEVLDRVQETRRWSGRRTLADRRRHGIRIRRLRQQVTELSQDTVEHHEQVGDCRESIVAEASQTESPDLPHPVATPKQISGDCGRH